MKAILLIDIPDGIFGEDCVINYEVQESVMQKIVSAGAERLRPLPEKNTWDVTDNGHVTEFAEGWNACLDEITGDKE